MLHARTTRGNSIDCSKKEGRKIITSLFLDTKTSECKNFVQNIHHNIVNHTLIDYTNHL